MSAFLLPVFAADFNVTSTSVVSAPVLLNIGIIIVAGMAFVSFVSYFLSKRSGGVPEGEVIIFNPNSGLIEGDAQEVDDSEEWGCSYCGAANKMDVMSCQHCHAPKRLSDAA